MRPIWRTFMISTAVCTLLTGCWSKIEINDRTFVSGFFVDRSAVPGEVELTITTMLPNRLTSGQQSGGGSEKGTPYASVTKSAKTLPFALQRIQADLTRKISWGLTRIVVVGRDYAEQGLDDLLEWVDREPTFHLRTYILIAEGKAKEIIRLTPVYERSPSEVLREFVNQHTLLNTNLRDLLDASYSGRDFAITALTFGSFPMVSEQNRISPWAGTNGAALFRNGKLIGFVTAEEARMLAWVKSWLRAPVFSVPVGDGKDKGSASVVFSMTRASIVPVFQARSIRFRIKLYGEATLLNAEMKEDITKPAVLHRTERQISQYLADHLQRALAQTKKLGSDALQLGAYVEWQRPKQWEQLQKEWRAYYKTNVDFDIEADVVIKSFGSETTSVQRKR
ncbi:Ger(x)C family spore germination protein [Paenibacillus tyrfis]|nr:Ger(x)C family spore germination protein [Paenibacillus tyrfis]